MNMIKLQQIENNIGIELKKDVICENWEDLSLSFFSGSTSVTTNSSDSKGSEPAVYRLFLPS
jgi:hypothetical protein